MVAFAAIIVTLWFASPVRSVPVQWICFGYSVPVFWSVSLSSMSCIQAYYAVNSEGFKRLRCRRRAAIGLRRYCSMIVLLQFTTIFCESAQYFFVSRHYDLPVEGPLHFLVALLFLNMLTAYLLVLLTSSGRYLAHFLIKFA